MINLKTLILESIEGKNINKIHELLTHKSNGIFTLDKLEEIANNAGLVYEEAPISEACEYDKELWLIVDEYILTFSGKYNVYGILDLKDITIYDKTDSAIIQKTF